MVKPIWKLSDYYGLMSISSQQFVDLDSAIKFVRMSQ